MHQNSDTCVVYEYGANRQNDCAKAVINGRYPERNFAMNEVSEMTVYVLSGLGRVATRDAAAELRPGDVCFIGKNEPYYYEGKDLAVLMVSTPPWSPDQYTETE